MGAKKPSKVSAAAKSCIADTSRDAARDIGNIPGMSSALIAEMRDLIALLERQMEGRDAILLNIAKP